MAHTKRVSLIMGLAAAISFGSTLPAQASSAKPNTTQASDSVGLELAPNLALAPEKRPAGAETIKFSTEFSTEIDPLVQPTDAGAIANPAAELAELPTADTPEASTEVAAPETEALEPGVLAPEVMPPESGVSTSADELMPSDTAQDSYDLDAEPDAGITDSPVEISQTTRAAYRGIPPAYVGAGGNLGFGDNESAVGDFGFAVISKISLGPRFALRPGAIIAEDRTSFTVPLTYNFDVYEVRGFRFQPYAGAGADIATDGDVGLLLNTGVDVPISRDFTLNATGNFRITDGFSFGLILGVGYNFPLIFE